MNTLIPSTAFVHSTRYSFYHVVLVKFYSDIITRTRLQLINTSINSFFSKLCTFLGEQREEGRPVMVKRKLDDAVDESSVDQKIHNSGATKHNL